MAGGGENDHSLSFIENSPPPLKDTRAPITQCGNTCVMGARNMYSFTNSGERDGLAEDSHAGLQAKAVAFSPL